MKYPSAKPYCRLSSIILVPEPHGFTNSAVVTVAVFSLVASTKALSCSTCAYYQTRDFFSEMIALPLRVDLKMVDHIYIIAAVGSFVTG